jgi:hypothetical protein
MRKSQREKLAGQGSTAQTGAKEVRMGTKARQTVSLSIPDVRQKRYSCADLHKQAGRLAYACLKAHDYKSAKRRMRLAVIFWKLARKWECKPLIAALAAGDLEQADFCLDDLFVIYRSICTQEEK